MHVGFSISHILFLKQNFYLYAVEKEGNADTVLRIIVSSPFPSIPESRDLSSEFSVLLTWLLHLYLLSNPLSSLLQKKAIVISACAA